MIIKKGVYTLSEILKLSDKKTKQQVERFLSSRNYIFSTEGRGKNTIFTIDGIEEVFKPTYPTAMAAYIQYIKDNELEWQWQSDSEVAWDIIQGNQKLKSKAYMIYLCRKQLTELGYIKDLQEQEDCKYFIKNKADKVEITEEEFFIEVSKRTAYKELLTQTRSEEVFALSNFDIKDIADEAFWESFSQIGGVLIRLKKRELLVGGSVLNSLL